VADDGTAGPAVVPERVGGLPASAAPRSLGLVLVVEDEPAIADVVRRYLERDGYRVALERSGTAALSAIRRDRPIAVVLDIGLPDLDGIAVCQRLRAADDWTPVLFITARDDDADRILGLEIGADDYLVKPFNPRELLARLRSVLRRSQPATAGRVLQVGAVRLDPAQHRVWAADVEIGVTATEFNLLAHLMRAPGQVFERGSLLQAVWGYSAVAGERTVDVHVAAVRAKLGVASPIRTVRGVGYAVQAPE
jgi:DNA-binding response OmpR family regulator